MHKEKSTKLVSSCRVNLGMIDMEHRLHVMQELVYKASYNVTLYAVLSKVT